VHHGRQQSEGGRTFDERRVSVWKNLKQPATFPAAFFEPRHGSARSVHEIGACKV